LNTWKKVVDSNLTGAFLVAQAAIKAFLKRKINGNIIFLSSTYGVVGPDPSIYQGLNSKKNIYGGKFALNTPAAYSSTKTGLIGLAKYIATNFGKYKIRANVLSPGGVYDKQEKKFVNKYKNKVPLNRMADWKDYNGAILFLASDASKYMTGTNLIIDGGWTAW
jgi:NAD(P)-dependent dehydrogenase (short-subunit alcohol dehydrogenase family)